jgi:hypothetical protein
MLDRNLQHKNIQELISTIANLPLFKLVNIVIQI